MDQNDKRRSRPISTVPVSIARDLRKRLTAQEAKLWNGLRALRPAGYHFRRQVPIASFVADFACLKHRLVIEIDGGQHNRDDHAAQDRARDVQIARLGYQTLRFWNAEVDQNLDGVIETILAHLQPASSLPSDLGPARDLHRHAQVGNTRLATEGRVG
jgi:very-short-patch-repair endonuclease